MSAIQEALERVKKEREASRQDDLSWVDATAQLGPCEGPRKVRVRLRFCFLVLAGAAIGLTASQISWTNFQPGTGVFEDWKQKMFLAPPKRDIEITPEKEIFEVGKQEVATSSQNAPRISLGKQLLGSPSDLKETVAASKKMQQEGNLKGAERELLALLEKEPTSVEALVALADLYLKDLSQTDRAIALYQKAIQETPKRASLWVNLGVAYMKNGDLAKAAETILSALELDPSVVEAHYNMACVLALQGRSQEAARFLEKAASMDSRVFEWAMQDPDLVSVKDFFPGKFQLP